MTAVMPGPIDHTRVIVVDCTCPEMHRRRETSETDGVMHIVISCQRCERIVSDTTRTWRSLSGTDSAIRYQEVTSS